MNNDMVPFLFPVGFVCFWFLVTRLLGWIAGWKTMARAWADPTTPPGARPFYESGWLSGTVGGVRYNNVLWAQIYPDAVRLGVLLPFRGGHPTLRIPRRAIQSGKLETGWFGIQTYSFKVEGVSLQLIGQGGVKLKEWIEAGDPD